MHLEESESQFHQKVCRQFAEKQALYERAKEELKTAEREYIESVGCHNAWFSHIAEKYGLDNNDRITEDGVVHKVNRGEDSKDG